MKKFLLDFIGFLAICIIVLIAVSFVTERGFKNGNYPRYSVLNGMENGTINTDVLIQGNSHARVQIDPFVIDSAIGSNSFNIGSDGICFDVQYARYLFYARYNRKPKMIIQVVDYVFFGISSAQYNREQYLPFLSNPDLFQMATRIDIPFYTKYFPFLKWQGEPNAVVAGIRSSLGKPEADDFKVNKGFGPNDYAWQTDVVASFRQKYPRYIPDFDPFVFHQFETYLQSCKNDSIRMVMVLPPEYTPFQKTVLLREGYLDMLRELAAKYNAIFLDFSKDPLCNHKEYFYNYTHLNREGARLFSERLAMQLKALKTAGLLY
ncbi:SGNH/GDSL hydrolase family protein [Taibaiella soli]|uniref:SGNH/GDSL hydrolase family protein n=1 Tax=Taibaiella soli TaxID=1649169 RepID=A0A2W2BFQ6_9BACT|nr:hypothetical protein [Taibaiella soli]PZF74707.1 hypothetical protein DN068_00475 [Taibaiella soli]